MRRLLRIALLWAVTMPIGVATPSASARAPADLATPAIGDPIGVAVGPDGAV